MITPDTVNSSTGERLQGSLFHLQINPAEMMARKGYLEQRGFCHHTGTRKVLIPPNKKRIIDEEQIAAVLVAGYPMES